MGFLPKNEFAAKCGMTTGNLTNYITRGKVVMSGDFIDDTLEINRDFLEARKELMKLKQEQEGDEEPDQSADVPKVKPVKLPARSKTIPGHSKSSSAAQSAATAKPQSEAANTARRKNETTVEKNLIDIKLKELDYDIQMGKYVATELVKLMFTQLGQSFVGSYRSFSEAMLAEICHKYGVNSSESATLRTKLTKDINVTHALAIKNAKTSLRQAIEKAAKRQILDDQTDI